MLRLTASGGMSAHDEEGHLVFGAKHYVPILKWKKAEQDALKALSEHARAIITPLLEIVEDDPDVAAKQAAKIVQCWGKQNMFFLDPGTLSDSFTEDGRSGAEVLFEAAQSHGLPFVPVTDLSEPSEVTGAVGKYSGRGACIRLSPDDVVEDGLERRLLARLKAIGVQPMQTDLLLDIGSIENEKPGSVFLKASGLFQQVPLAQPWRTITVAATAFPYSMARLPRNTISRVQRTEWLVWRVLILQIGKSRQTVPAFGDYGIQHPELIEFARPMRMSANIRYAIEKDWLIAKGEDVYGEAGFDQAYNIAKTLSENPAFLGETHCAGCAAIMRMARREGGPGNATRWRWVGTVHHLTLTANQVASVSAL